MPRVSIRWMLCLMAATGLCGSAAAQKYVLDLRPAPGADVTQLRQRMPGFPKQVHSGRRLQRAFWGLVPALQRAGFLAASVDTVFRSGDTLVAVVQPDLPYQWISLSLDRVDAAVLARLKTPASPWTNRPLDPPQLLELTRALLRSARRQGYRQPLWRIRSVNMLPDGGVSGTVHLHDGDR